MVEGLYECAEFINMALSCNTAMDYWFKDKGERLDGAEIQPSPPPTRKCQTGWSTKSSEDPRKTADRKGKCIQGQGMAVTVIAGRGGAKPRAREVNGFLQKQQ